LASSSQRIATTLRRYCGLLQSKCTSSFTRTIPEPSFSSLTSTINGTSSEFSLVSSYRHTGP
uniref:Ovule protein n=1 Tax=Brugia timori TaxID=42155 RepID=A0A0R3RB11_9BILA